MSNVFQTCLKSIKLKKMVIEPKTAQPVEPDEEPIDLFGSTDRGCKNLLSLLEHYFNRSSGNQRVVEV